MKKFIIFLFIFSLGAVMLAEDKMKSNMSKNGDEWLKLRMEMVQLLKDYYGISNQAILRAMAKVPRHLFIPEKFRDKSEAYGDHPCPIGYGQTISQPYIVAYMTEKLDIKAGEKVLEIGTGSGYQAAVLAELGAQVFTIEIIPELAEHARKVLKQQGYENVKVITGDGYKGLPEEAPFDAIIVTCAPPEMPEALLKQLKDGGRLIAPVGSFEQRLIITVRRGDKFIQKEDLLVRFVPMVKEEKDKK